MVTPDFEQIVIDGQDIVASNMVIQNSDGEIEAFQKDVFAVLLDPAFAVVAEDAVVCSVLGHDIFLDDVKIIIWYIEIRHSHLKNKISMGRYTLFSASEHKKVTKFDFAGSQCPAIGARGLEHLHHISILDSQLVIRAKLDRGILF